MFEGIVKEIESYSRIIIHRHTNPDGDALGSQTGLKLLLKENYPDKEVYAVGDPSVRYGFIEGSEADEVADELYEGALAIILDTSAAALISDDRYKTASRTVRIDHHLFVEKIADTEVTDNSYESCAGLIAELSREQGWRLTPVAAKALYTGMITDSGRFRYDSTSAGTFERAAYLMSVKFDTTDIYSNLYADDFKFIRLRASFVLKIQFTEKRVAYIYTTESELAELAVDTFTVSRGMVNTMGEIRGTDIWVNFTESEGKVLAELRSSKYNINQIAVKYGGGGHLKASGATLASREEAMAMLADLDALIEQ